MLKNEAYTTLEKMIVKGSLAPGEWTSETKLIAASGCTHASIRSAVQRLENQMLVKAFPRRGVQICPIDYTMQFRALELRRSVETLIARSGAKRATIEQKEVFSKIAKKFLRVAKSGDQKAMIECDTNSYSLFLELADNPFAAKAMTSVKVLSRRFWIMYSKKYGDVVKMAKTHASIALAISNGNEEDADRAVAELINYVEEFTLRVFRYST